MMSSGAQKPEVSSLKRLHSDKHESVPFGSITTQSDLIKCFGISPFMDIKKPQETLPDLDDPYAIDAFFRRSKRQRSPAHEASEGTLPSNHPMKEFVEQPENREMSVKEALARGFRNYRVRLPKNRRVLVPTGCHQSGGVSELSNSTTPKTNKHNNFLDTTNPGSHQLPSTSHSDLFQEESLLQSKSTTTVNLNDILASTFVPRDIFKQEVNDLKQSLNENEESECNINVAPDSSAYTNYTITPFWQLNSRVSKGYKGGYYVEGVKYVQVTTLILNSSFYISLNKPIRFQINGEITILTLKQLFAVNGIIIRDPSNVEQLQEVFNSSFLLINHSIAQFLLDGLGSASDNTLSQQNKLKTKVQDAILLSTTNPPFACYQLPMFLMSLGTKLGQNEILDRSNALVDSPAASRSSSPVDRPSTEICEQELSTYTEVETKEEPLDIVTHNLRHKLLVLTSVVAGKELSQVAEKYGITREQVESIVHDRSEIEQEASQMFIEESREEKITEDISNMNEQTHNRIIDSPPKELRSIKKNRVRRTSFVGLNVLMWRFFKECADNNIILNGKQLKEHAMIIAKKLGLDQFKGSEGWLDAFKRRHKIDLKQMTGSPANYEDDGIEDVRPENDEIVIEDGRNSAETQRSSPLYYSSNTNAASNGSVTAALLNTVEKASQPTAVASISSTIPLDLQHLLGETVEADLINGIMTSNTPFPYMSTGVTGFINIRDYSNDNNQQSDEKGLIAAVVRSAAVHIPDKEISFAMDTIRSYILTHDSAAMPKFLELQIQLANIAKNASLKKRIPTSSNSGSTGSSCHSKSDS